MISTSREAFIVGVTHFAKEAELDRDDTRELVRCLFMKLETSLPILKAASDIQTAQLRSKAGAQLVKLGSDDKVAGILDSIGRGVGFMFPVAALARNAATPGVPGGKNVSPGQAADAGDPAGAAAAKSWEDVEPEMQDAWRPKAPQELHEMKRLGTRVPSRVGLEYSQARAKAQQEAFEAAGEKVQTRPPVAGGASVEAGQAEPVTDPQSPLWTARQDPSIARHTADPEVSESVAAHMAKLRAAGKDPEMIKIREADEARRTARREAAKPKLTAAELEAEKLKGWRAGMGKGMGKYHTPESYAGAQQLGTERQQTRQQFQALHHKLNLPGGYGSSDLRGRDPATFAQFGPRMHKALTALQKYQTDERALEKFFQDEQPGAARWGAGLTGDVQVRQRKPVAQPGLPGAAGAAGVPGMEGRTPTPAAIDGAVSAAGPDQRTSAAKGTRGLLGQPEPPAEVPTSTAPTPPPVANTETTPPVYTGMTADKKPESITYGTPKPPATPPVAAAGKQSVPSVKAPTGPTGYRPTITTGAGEEFALPERKAQGIYAGKEGKKWSQSTA